MKKYSTPSIQTMKSLSFETVCAGSGAGRCIINPDTRFTITASNYNPCGSCFQENHPGFMDTVAAMPGGNIQANREKAIMDIINSGGTCPGGFTSIG